MSAMALPGLLPHERALLRGNVVPYVAGQSLADWYPMALDGSGEQPLLAWRYLGERRLSGAFFQDNFSALDAADMRVCYTPLSALAQFDAGQGLRSLQPSAFVFHVSRCGSTLVTQMLSQLPSCVALSEPPVLDSFFRLMHAQPLGFDWALIFRQLLAALGQARRASEAHLIVKLDCWHAPWMSWVRQVYPDVPMVFVPRAPAGSGLAHTPTGHANGARHVALGALAVDRADATRGRLGWVCTAGTGRDFSLGRRFGAGQWLAVVELPAAAKGGVG
jgi:hypothetical protein